jgi:hypothetical protein
MDIATAFLKQVMKIIYFTTTYNFLIILEEILKGDGLCYLCNLLAYTFFHFSLCRISFTEYKLCKEGVNCIVGYNHLDFFDKNPPGL